MLDKPARARLRTLSKSNADHVARHLVMAGRLIGSDPQRAYDHARTAVYSAGRVDVVREALALSAYATGRYAEALRELRTVRRLSGVDAHPAIEADCERGRGRPERALDVLADARSRDLPEEEAVEVAIVESGARADLGQYDAGLVVVENAAARVRERAMLDRLELVRIDRLTDLGRTDEAERLRRQGTPAPDVVVVTDLADGAADQVDGTEGRASTAGGPAVDPVDGTDAGASTASDPTGTPGAGPESSAAAPTAEPAPTDSAATEQLPGGSAQPAGETFPPEGEDVATGTQLTFSFDEEDNA